MKPPVIVIGAGVIGLTTAVVLAEDGYRVQVVAAEPPEATTSAVAGALWGPWLVEPRSRVLPWAEHTLRVLRELAEIPDSGVRIAAGREITNGVAEPPDWASLLDDRTPCHKDDLPAGYRHGVRYSAPLIDMPAHLAYLEARLGRAGGPIEIRRLTSIQEAAYAPEAVVVNCSGIGARELVPDPDLYPVCGYHVVTTNPGLSEFLEADTGSATDLVAIYPHADHVILGGTAEPHVWGCGPDEAIAAGVLERCVEIEPRLAGVRVIGHRIGLRPTRQVVRLEAEKSPLRPLIIHCYGHGGAGVSLAWGCAAGVSATVRDQSAEALRRERSPRGSNPQPSD